MTDSSEEMQRLKDQISSLESTLLQQTDDLEAMKMWSNPQKSPEKDELEQKLRQVYPSLVSLLKDDGVALVYQITVDEIQRQIFNTSPEQTEIRERLYYQAQGLQSVWTKMAAIKRGIERALEEEAKQNIQ